MHPDTTIAFGVKPKTFLLIFFDLASLLIFPDPAETSIRLQGNAQAPTPLKFQGILNFCGAIFWVIVCKM